MSRQRFYAFSNSVLCLGKSHENPRINTAWEDRLAWFKSSPEYRTLDRIVGEPKEFEWKIFPRLTTLQLSHIVQELLLKLGEAPENFTGRIIFMSMFNDISWDRKTPRKNANQMLNSLLSLQKDSEQERTSKWKTKQITIERRNPLFAVMQITSVQR